MVNSFHKRANYPNLVYNLGNQKTAYCSKGRFVRLPKRSELGTPITKYHLQELLWKDLLRVFTPLTFIVLAPVGYGLWRTLYGYSSFGPAAAASWGKTWFLIGGGLVIALLFYALSRLGKAHTWIEIYSWGLYLHFPPGRKRLLQWEDIQGITSYSINKRFLRIINRKKHYLSLHSRRYPPLQCHPDLDGREGLKKTIKKQVYTRLRPKLLNAFKTGQTIPFGEISISQEMLFLPKQEIPWDYIEGISVEKGILNINLSTQKELEIPIRKLQNLEILIHIIKTEI